MTEEEVLAEFQAAGALQCGHLVLSSGLHSGVFLQNSLVFMHPDRTERLCGALAGKIRATAGRIDVVVSPAIGAMIPGYETARQPGAPPIALTTLDAPACPTDALPAELAALPVEDPGSRRLSA